MVWTGTEEKSIPKRALALYIDIYKHSVYEWDNTSMLNDDREKVWLANTLGNGREWLRLPPSGEDAYTRLHNSYDTCLFSWDNNMYGMTAWMVKMFCTGEKYY